MVLIEWLDHIHVIIHRRLLTHQSLVGIFVITLAHITSIILLLHSL